MMHLLHMFEETLKVSLFADRVSTLSVTKGQTWEVGMWTDSRPLVTDGGDARRVSWTQLVVEVWEGCWKYELSRGVHIGPP